MCLAIVCVRIHPDTVKGNVLTFNAYALTISVLNDIVVVVVIEEWHYYLAVKRNCMLHSLMGNMMGQVRFVAV